MRLGATGGLSGTARRSRSRALWLAGHDTSTPAVARYLARLVSAYERAPVRDILTLGIFSMVEGAATGIMMRMALRSTGVSIAPVARDMPPGSGWRGTVLALAIWLLPFVVIAIASRW